MARSLRPASADDLGMRRALSDRLLPALVGAMVFLAALALGGAMAAATLAERWNTGAAAMLTVTVPMPDTPLADTQPAGGTDGVTRAEAVSRLLAATPGVAKARRLQSGEIATLLKPWLGADDASLALHFPAIFELRLAAGTPAPELDARLAQAAPGTLVEHNGAWLTRLADLVRSLQACAALALLVVAFVAAAVVGVATRAGLAARRDAIEIVHGLGATDRLIAGQFAHRITILVLSGATLGLVPAIPVLIGLASLAAPFTAEPVQHSGIVPLLAVLPPLLWGLLLALPPTSGLIAWLTAQSTVRGWLRRLP
jgi:cell division transport system permease protein